MELGSVPRDHHHTQDSRAAAEEGSKENKTSGLNGSGGGGDQYRGRSRRVVRGAVPHGSEQEPGEKDSQRTRVLSPCTEITSLEEEVEGRTLEATVSEGV